MSTDFAVSSAQRIASPDERSLAAWQNAVAWAVRRSCVLLDEERFSEWVGLFDEGANYRILAHSPEIQRTMTWLELDRDGLADLVSKLGFHLRDPGRRTRLASVMQVEQLEGNDRAFDALTRVVMYDTDEKGRTSLWAVASYRDRWRDADGALALARRDVEMDTRLLETGSLAPL